MKFETVLYEVKDNIATITLNRPDRMNAWTLVMMTEVIEAFDLADHDDEVKVVILTGAGKAFCAGADLSSGKPRAAEQKAEGEPYRDSAGQAVLKIYDMNKPVIAAVDGPAVGVGATILLPADIRLATDRARFGFVFNRRGFVPEGCCTWFLPRILGMAKATEWLYSGRVFSAVEAYEGGLISQILRPEKLMPTAIDLAREIADNNSALSTALTRKMVYSMLSADHPMDAHILESKCFEYMATSEDAKEGIASFLEKRPPKFSMKPSKDMPAFYPWQIDRKFSGDL
jgi:enoyl-CoA hydratase/carnithine racemase